MARAQEELKKAAQERGPALTNLSSPQPQSRRCSRVFCMTGACVARWSIVLGSRYVSQARCCSLRRPRRFSLLRPAISKPCWTQLKSVGLCLSKGQRLLLGLLSMLRRRQAAMRRILQASRSRQTQNQIAGQNALVRQRQGCTLERRVVQKSLSEAITAQREAIRLEQHYEGQEITRHRQILRR